MSQGSGDVTLRGHGLTIGDVVRVARLGATVTLADDEAALGRVLASCDYIAEAVARGDAIYGVTTALGGMANIVISRDEASELQNNALWAHKTGTGHKIANDCVRAAMLLRANSHMKGASGIRLEMIRRVATFLHAGVTPHVREFGSIGASGDLVPLAAITGTLIGLDPGFTADFSGEEVDALTALDRLGLPRVRLGPKEGLAMINGTSASAGIAALNVHDARKFLDLTIATHALFIQALCGTNQSFHPFIQLLKPHAGQSIVASRLLEMLAGSQLIRDELDGRHDHRFEDLIQDRYSLRCLPQYLGPIAEGLEHIASQIEIEINSANDNPLIDVDSNASYHGGNFLGQYVAVGMDQLRYFIALTAKHLDVQIAMLVAPEFSKGLSPSLVGNTERKTNMGLKGLQLTANSIVPMLAFLGNSIADRYPTYAEQFNQNINSQSFGSANLTRRSLEIFRQYLAIALLFGVQAVDLRTYRLAGHYDARACLSAPTSRLYEAVRNVVGREPSPNRPYIWNDDEQLLDQHITRIDDDLKVGGLIGQALDLSPPV
jgi:phenylalanine ammonia-lyase